MVDQIRSFWSHLTLGNPSMLPLSQKPYIYEINTIVWLNELSRRFNRPITLNSIPDEVLDEIANLGITTVWLMGIWQRSEAARQSALNYIHEYRPALPDLEQVDVTGSPYAIYDYTVDREMGGEAGLKHLRVRLQKRKISLILDFVPNHMSTDAHWLKHAPHFFMQGTAELHEKDDLSFLKTTDVREQDVIVARGRDPYFPAWIDTAQLNAFHPDLRQQVIETLLRLATICDGVRCDMAMLMTNAVFRQTWGWLLKDTPTPPAEYWREVISAVKAQFPTFIFIAEVYWNMESDLLQQGFHYTYDKRLYDRLIEGNAATIRTHLIADISYQNRLVRFIENHDEPRAGSTFGYERQPGVAVLAFTLPGALLTFHGQFEGAKVKIPVQLGRAPQEVVNPTLKLFYRELFKELQDEIYCQGIWRLFDYAPFNGFPYSLVTHGWYDPASASYRLIVVNVSGAFTKGIIPLKDWHTLAGRSWVLVDVLHQAEYPWDGTRMVNEGLYVELQGFDYHLFHFEQRN